MDDLRIFQLFFFFQLFLMKPSMLHLSDFYKNWFNKKIFFFFLPRAKLLGRDFVTAISNVQIMHNFVSNFLTLHHKKSNIINNQMENLTLTLRDLACTFINTTGKNSKWQGKKSIGHFIVPLPSIWILMNNHKLQEKTHQLLML